jgi:DNA (cytosine-5)-methyltransferase 1
MTPSSSRCWGGTARERTRPTSSRRGICAPNARRIHPPRCQVRVLDLFSGIGGFSLGIERAGMRTVQFVEIDPFCQHVLKQHWPEVPLHGDIRTFHAPAGFADVICGGFPCQDLSFAGAGAGLAGERSGLWSEYARIIGEVRPRFVIVENVAALLARGLGDVLRDLAALGYDAEWHCIPSSAVGAPHRRDRVWIVGYPHHEGESTSPLHAEASWLPKAMADTEGDGGDGLRQTGASRQGRTTGGRGRQHLGAQWRVEPDVDRVADGVPARMDRLRALGNAVVPQIPEIIGRAIMAADEASAPLSK